MLLGHYHQAIISVVISFFFLLILISLILLGVYGMFGGSLSFLQHWSWEIRGVIVSIASFERASAGTPQFAHWETNDDMRGRLDCQIGL